MRLRIRFAVLAAAVLSALPLQAADDGPAAVLQTASVGKILKDVREAANIVAADVGPKAIDDFLKTTLGEKGFSGLDLGKPVLGYVIFDEKDAEKTRFVLLVPIAKEADFLDLLKRCHLEPEEVKDAKGLYKLGSFDLPQGDKPLAFEVMMRIIGTTAYVGFNVTADALDPAKVAKAEKIFDAKETALFAYKQFNDRISPEVLKGNLKSVEDSVAKIKESLGGAGVQEKAILSAVEKLAQSMVKMSLDAKETGSRLILDTASGELSIDTYYTPKPGSEFAKSLAARKPTVNQFAGLAGPETAAGLMLQMPVGMKEMQDLMVAGIETLQEKTKEDPAPPFAKDLVEETFKGFTRTVKSGDWDLAAAMNGPDKDGHFTFCAAMSFSDPRPIEKALKASMKDFPAIVREAFKFDVDKVADLDMHSISPPEMPEEFSKIFGDAKIYVVFGPKAVYVALGNGAKDALKVAITGKPGPANAFDVLVNPKRLGQVIAAADAGAGAMAEKIMGTEDKTMSSYTMSIAGGESLRMKFSINLKILPRFMFMASQAFGG